MNTAVKAPITKRINPRMIIFTGVVGLLLLYPIYIFLHETITGGMVQEGNAVKVDLKALGNFPFDQTVGSINDVPEQWRGLDGKRVALVGEMYAPNSASDQLRDFQLVYNIQKCCFGGPPKVQERVFAMAPKGKTVPYFNGLARVEGTLRVKPEKQNGQIVSLYTMEVDNAEQQ